MMMLLMMITSVFYTIYLNNQTAFLEANTMLCMKLLDFIKMELY